MATLAQLAAAEKSYTALLFLVPKSFLRKENSLRTTYESLRMECRRTGEFSGSSPLDALVVHLLGQLAQFATGRLDLMELYVTLVAVVVAFFLWGENLTQPILTQPKLTYPNLT